MIYYSITQKIISESLPSLKFTNLLFSRKLSGSLRSVNFRADSEVNFLLLLTKFPKKIIMYQIILFTALLFLPLSCTTPKATTATPSTSNETSTLVGTKHQMSNDTIKKIVKTEEEWKAELTPEEYHVIREKGTERPFTGDLLKNKGKGIYTCAACALPLFSSDTKFDSGTGWPSYWKPINETNVAEETDNKYGWNRVEVLCARCDGHLGHVFDDGPEPTGLRYCINAVSLDFVEEGNY